MSDVRKVYKDLTSSSWGLVLLGLATLCLYLYNVSVDKKTKSVLYGYLSPLHKSLHQMYKWIPFQKQTVPKKLRALIGKNKSQTEQKIGEILNMEKKSNVGQRHEDTIILSKKTKQQDGSTSCALGKNKKVASKQERRRRSYASKALLNVEKLKTLPSQEEREKQDREKEIERKRFEELCAAQEQSMLAYAKNYREWASKKHRRSSNEKRMTSAPSDESVKSSRSSLSSSSSSSISKDFADTCSEYSFDEASSLVDDRILPDAAEVELNAVSTTNFAHEKDENKEGSRTDPIDSIGLDSRVDETQFSSKEKHEVPKATPAWYMINVTFFVHCAQIPPSLYRSDFSPIHVATSVNGDWNKLQSVPMYPLSNESTIWKLVLSIPSIATEFSYKYVAWDWSMGAWDHGPIVIANLSRYNSPDLYIRDSFIYSNTPICRQVVVETSSREEGQGTLRKEEHRSSSALMQTYQSDGCLASECFAQEKNTTRYSKSSMMRHQLDVCSSMMAMDADICSLEKAEEFVSDLIA